MIKLAEKIRERGLRESLNIIARRLSNHISHKLDKWRFRDEPRYVNPTPQQLEKIERDLSELGIKIEDYCPNPAQFHEFQKQDWFPHDYHGGRVSGVWDEKLLEHWIVGELLGLADWNEDDIYIDVAACNSPWAKALRNRLNVAAYAIDISPVADAYSELPYYRSENATRTSFADGSVRGASLQCAYEMFMGRDDQLLIGEIERILQPGGKVVILPLYMHTHYCAYSTPEYYGKGYSDPDAREYIRMDCYGVPSSRKYDALHLRERILDPINQAGLSYRLMVLRNKEAFGKNIYCYFILEIEK